MERRPGLDRGNVMNANSAGPVDVFRLVRAQDPQLEGTSCQTTTAKTNYLIITPPLGNHKTCPKTDCL